MYLRTVGIVAALLALQIHSGDGQGALSTVSITTCTPSSLVVEVTRGSNLAGEPYVYGHKGGAGCAVTGSGPFTVTYSTLSECDLTQTGQVHTTTIIVPKQSTGIETSEDEVFTINCNPVDPQTSSISSGTLQTGNVLDNSATGSDDFDPGSPVVSMALAFADTGTTASGTVSLGRSLSLTLSLDNDQSGAYGSFKGHTCVATPTSGSLDTPNITLIEPNGCASNTDVFGAFEASGSDIKATFPAFKFPNFDVVYYHCLVLVCPAHDPSPCAPGNCTSPDAGLGRKKRDALQSRVRRQSEEPEFTNRTLKRTTSIRVVINGLEDAHGNQHAIATENTLCLESSIIFAMGAMIGFLVLVIIVVVVVQCIRRPKLNKGGDEKFSVNGGFQT